MDFFTTEIIAVSMILLLLLGIFLGHYLGFVLGGLAVIITYFEWGSGSFYIFANRIFSVMDNYILVAIPLFVLMAQFLDKGGIAEKLFNSVRYLFASVRGGVAITVIVVSTLLGACTGIIGASVVTMGLIALPIMLKYGYDKRLCCGVICAGGTLGILIPPSIMLIIMASLAEESVGRIFAGAVFPGLILSSLYIIYILIRAYMRADLFPSIDVDHLESSEKKKILKTCLINLIPPLLLIFGVLGSIFAGIATPTEAAGVGAFLAFVLMVLDGKASFKNIQDAVIKTALITGMIMYIIIGANCFTTVFMSIQADTIITDLLLNLGVGKWMTFFIMMIILFILGLFLDWTAIIMITLPIFLPIAASLGFDKVWFVVTMAVMLQDSFLTPPFGGALFYLRGVAPEEVSTSDIYWGVFPFWRLMEVGLLIVVLFPGTITWLPSVLFD
jgi:tripartite ATP-independent transporter DctM subunit